MLFSEQVRLLESEERLINDATEYGAASTSWVAIHNYGNITLTEDGLVVFTYDLHSVNSGSIAYARLKIGSYYVHGARVYGTLNTTFHGLAWLGAGTYAVIIEVRTDGETYQAHVSNFQLGKAKFSDSVGHALAVCSSQISKTVGSRKLAVGPLKNAVFCVHVFAYTPNAVTYFENPGQNYTNGVRVSVDSVQVAWSERYQDEDSKENGYAKCYHPVTVGGTHAIDIAKDNANTVVHISIACSPWLLSDRLYEPVTADFTQSSTFYAVLEPLSGNVTKGVKVGKTRAASFGDSTDYYSSSSGTGILSYSYTFEKIEIGKVGIFLSGLGGCVSVIGVDVR